MKRKNKKTQKTKEKTPSNPTESDKTGSEKEQSRKSIKTESFEQEANNIDADTENSSNSNKTDEMSSDLNGTESIKLEKTDDSQSSGSYAAEEKKSFSDSNSMCDMTNVDETFLFVELKLISIEQSCLNYKKLTQKFLCINSNALVDHLKKLIVKKMSLPGEFYEIVLMCNGFEVKTGCPLVFLKNKFFPKEENLILYYAIVEQEAMPKEESYKTEAATEIDVK